MTARPGIPGSRAREGGEHQVLLSIAVLMTCHNRRELTLRCLQTLFEQDSDAALDVFLVDDGSVDGTAEAVRDQYPGVTVIEGTGKLYWAGGMRLAYEGAVLEEHDFHLWLNDDVELFPSAISVLLETHASLAGGRSFGPIVVGALKDGATGATTYGGLRSSGRLRPTAFERVEPSDVPQRCDAMNGNVVLVPEEVRRRVGGPDDRFTHALADLDYALRAQQLGCSVWLAPGSVGYGARNPPESSWNHPAMGRSARLRHLLSNKGLPPRDWVAFTRRHAGALWPLYWASPYVKAGIKIARGR